MQEEKGGRGGGRGRLHKWRLVYLALVGELGGGDVELLVLLLQLGELGLQLGLVQLGAVQLALCVLVVQLEVLVVPQQLPVGGVQPERKRCLLSGRT